MWRKEKWQGPEHVGPGGWLTAKVSLTVINAGMKAQVSGRE